ncbi:hypothetical protein K469DRAFT_320237 [Zopfia rhizophila CBS 207.26]|uniref:Uncharacterized protein n=1 Tax=Zopfia rhizophila CBS 207.26 TaxID=1314779 RepID=A0A6A6DLS7_9PEZI|nr:hypothetical protein K469DRAFT_320237 [Zopfia rhizophila CBS 207.26]
MESLSIQMSSIFNTSAFFSNMNRTDIRYSNEWGPRLTSAVFGGDSDTAPDCPVERRGNGWQNPNPYVLIREYGFQTTLAGIANSLSDAFRYDHRLSQDVFGTYTYQETALLVDFRWFILPAVLYGIVAVFFAATMFTTRNTPMWKSSPLPLLHAMREDGGVGSGDRVRKEAKGSRMKLRRAATGWQLVEGTEARKRGSL